MYFNIAALLNEKINISFSRRLKPISIYRSKISFPCAFNLILISWKYFAATLRLPYFTGYCPLPIFDILKISYYGSSFMLEKQQKCKKSNLNLLFFRSQLDLYVSKIFSGQNCQCLAFQCLKISRIKNCGLLPVVFMRVLLFQPRELEDTRKYLRILTNWSKTLKQLVGCCRRIV